MKQIVQFLVFSLLLTLSFKAQQQGGRVSPVKVEKFTVANVEVSLNYYDQRLIPLDNQIKEITKSAFAEMTRLFGGLPKDVSGNDYKQFQVDLRYGFAEADSDPNLINLQFDEELERQPVFGYITWRLALIHEMFHFWSAETWHRFGLSSPQVSLIQGRSRSTLKVESKSKLLASRRPKR